MEKIDTGLAQLDNCTNPTLIYSPSKSFTSQKACACVTFTLANPIQRLIMTIFTTMIIFQDVLKQKALFKNALWTWSDKGGYQLAKEIRILQPEKLNKMDVVVFVWKI